MQVSTGLRSHQTYASPHFSPDAPVETAPGEDARWFAEHYPRLTPLSAEYTDAQGRHLCLWKSQEGLLATVYDSRHQTFKILRGAQIRNALNPDEPPHFLQARLASFPCVQWDLVLRGDVLYIWPRLRAAAWQDFIPTDGTVNTPNQAFKGTHTLMEAMGVLYKEGFTTTETARVCIQYQEGEDTVVTELTTTNHNDIRDRLNSEGRIIAIYTKGNTRAGIEFCHPQDTSQTTFHAVFSENVPHIDVRLKASNYKNG